VSNRSKWSPLFDHLVGCDEQARRDDQTQRLGRFEIDDGFVLGRSLHRQVRGFVPAQDAINTGGCLPKLINAVGAVAHEAAIRDENTVRVHRRKAVLCREGNDEIAMVQEREIGRDQESAVWCVGKGLNGALDVRRSTGFETTSTESEGARASAARG
jgi:hypothetical protein